MKEKSTRRLHPDSISGRVTYRKLYAGNRHVQFGRRTEASAQARLLRPDRLDAFGQRSLVEILERSGTHTGHGGRSFEQTFQIMVVVFVQAPNGKKFLRTPHLT